VVLVGDIHGEFDSLVKIIYSVKDVVVQLGDLGIGFQHRYVNPAFFLDKDAPYELVKITDFQYDRKHFVFIRGNHDAPEMCRKHHNYLGEFGVFKKVFYVSGAWSIDRAYRKEGLDWWPDEELNMKQMYDALEMYTQVKPDIVMTHECPTSISQVIHLDSITNRTGQLMDAMLREHQPQQWFFAHHHTSWHKKVGKTDFRCLNCFETARI
jgi:hypothetical protein